jgi:lysophospholipase L1-like esterase
MLNNSCDLGLKTRVTSSGQPPWGDSDPVHLTPDGYRDLAIIITDGIQAARSGDTGRVSGSSNGSQK